MSTLDRQRRRPQFGAQTIALQGNTPHGRNVVAAPDREAPALQDVPIRGYTGPEDDTHNEPMNEPMKAAFEAARNQPKPDPVLEEPEAAWMLLELLNEQGIDGLGEEKYNKGLRMVNKFVAANPGAFDNYKMEKKHAAWRAENLDDTPQKSSRLWKAQKEALRKRTVMQSQGRDPGASGGVYEQIKVPQALSELPPAAPGSRAAVLRAEEESGLDTFSGLTSFSEQFNLARKVNGSGAQFSMLYALAKDNLEREGVTLPEGMHPVNYNENLGQLEALVPTEEGKVRRVLIDSEFLRVADLGSAADIEEWMAGIGATLSQLPGAGKASGFVSETAQNMAKKHPAIAEFVGDFGWRNTGVVLEGLLDAEALGGGTGLDDVAEALEGNLSESGFNTAFSRLAGRLMPGGSGKSKEEIEMLREQYFRTGDTPQDTIDRAVKEVSETVEESARTLEDLQKLTDRQFVVDRGSASGSDVEIGIQRGRESRLNPRETTVRNAQIRENRKALKDAVDNVHNNRMPTNPAAYEETTEVAVRQAIEDKDAAVHNIETSTIDVHGAGGGQTHYTWSWRQGNNEVNMGGLGKGVRQENDLTDIPSGAKAIVDHEQKTITIKYLGEDTAFPGGTPVLLQQMMKDMDGIPSDYRIISDEQMSQFSMAMIGRLEKEGFGIKQNDILYTSQDGNIEWTYAPKGEGVFEITHVPGRQTRMALVDDVAGYEKEKIAQTLDDDLAFVANAQAQADFWGVKLNATIGWQPDRAKSIYSIANPRTSEFNKFATRLEARINNSLTGAEVSQADALLGATFLKQQDEEGYQVIAGLTDPTLDFGNLLRARDSLQAIAERTGDREVANLVAYADNMLENGKMLDNFGNPADEAAVTAVRNTLDSSRSAGSTLRNAESRITSNPLFKKNELGEYINTDLKTMGTMLRSGSKFMQHLKPWLHANTDGMVSVQGALMDLYRKDVLNSGSGFTRSKHSTFLANYDTALREVFSPEDLKAFNNNNFDAAGANIFESRIERSLNATNRLRQWGTLRPGKILEDLRAVGVTGKTPDKRMAMYVRELDKLNPELGAQVRADSLEESRRYINEAFFGNDAAQNPRLVPEKFNAWIKQNEGALRALHGDQYVTDLKTIRRGMELDARRLRISPETAQLQGDVVRTSRTLMGPLSVFQRRVSAANWIRLRMNAKRATEVLSDPAKVRALVAAEKYPARSRPGVAALIRAGLITGTGWTGGEGVASWREMPDEVYEQGVEWVDWMKDVGDELTASALEDDTE